MKDDGVSGNIYYGDREKSIARWCGFKSTLGDAIKNLGYFKKVSRLLICYIFIYVF